MPPHAAPCLRSILRPLLLPLPPSIVSCRPSPETTPCCPLPAACRNSAPPQMPLPVATLPPHPAVTQPSLCRHPDELTCRTLACRHYPAATTLQPYCRHSAGPPPCRHPAATLPHPAATHRQLRNSPPPPPHMSETTLNYTCLYSHSHSHSHTSEKTLNYTYSQSQSQSHTSTSTSTSIRTRKHTHTHTHATRIRTRTRTRIRTRQKR